MWWPGHGLRDWLSDMWTLVLITTLSILSVRLGAVLRTPRQHFCAYAAVVVAVVVFLSLAVISGLFEKSTVIAGVAVCYLLIPCGLMNHLKSQDSSTRV